MLKLHKCELCGERFKPTKNGRIQIIKKTSIGKDECWICQECAPIVREKLKEINLKI